MKTIALLFFSVLTFQSAFAQPDVTSAYNANKDGKYEDAKTYIDKSASDPKATSKEKYWRYRGDIYLNIAKDPGLVAKYPDALNTSIESYFKQLEIDTHKDYINETKGGLGMAQMLASEQAVAFYGTGDYCNAAKNFEQSLSISDKFGILDSALIFNTAFCYDKCGVDDKALAGYKRTGAIGYNVPDVYIYSSEIYTKQNKKEEALKVLSDARAKHPKDANLLRTEVNIYLSDSSYEKAETLLKSLTEADPSNESIWFVLGVTYEKLNKKTDEEEAYKKAIAIKADYYDALFNLGAMYFNQGLEIEKTCSDIPPREKARYDDCVSQAKTFFGKSVQQLEKAQKVKPEEKEIVSALKDAYYKNEDMEGYAKMKALLSK